MTTTFTANLVFVPEQTSILYPEHGVDFLLDRDLADTGETQGAAEHVTWIEAQNPTIEGRQVEDGEVIDPGTWELAEADEIIAAQGFERTSDWETIDQHGTAYLTATIAPAE